MLMEGHMCVKDNMVLTLYMYLIILQMVCKGMLKWCLRGLLGQTDSLSLLLLEEHDEQSIMDAETLNESLALLERDFPISLQVKWLFMQQHFI